MLDSFCGFKQQQLCLLFITFFIILERFGFQILECGYNAGIDRANHSPNYEKLNLSIFLFFKFSKNEIQILKFHFF